MFHCLQRKLNSTYVYHLWVCIIHPLLSCKRGVYYTSKHTCMRAWLSIFFKSTSTLQCTFFYQNLNNFHEYLIQHSLKSRGTKDHLRRGKVPGTAPYWKACMHQIFLLDFQAKCLLIFGICSMITTIQWLF